MLTLQGLSFADFQPTFQTLFLLKHPSEFTPFPSRPFVQRFPWAKRQKGCDSVISIHNFELPVSYQANDRFGEPVIGGNKVCTCLKPLFTPAHACKYCVSSFFTSLNEASDAHSRSVAKWYHGKLKFHQFPFASEPYFKGRPGENILPFRFFKAFSYAYKWPSVFFCYWGDPHVVNLIRHIWKKFTWSHNELSSANVRGEVPRKAGGRRAGKEGAE